MTPEFGFIGWCCDDNHDKIWGYFFRDHNIEDSVRPWYLIPYRNVCIFWGRRGRAMQFKSSVCDVELVKLTQTKENKGYVKIYKNKLFEIWPTFQEEMESKLIVEILSGKIK